MLGEAAGVPEEVGVLGLLLGQHGLKQALVLLVDRPPIPLLVVLIQLLLAPLKAAPLLAVPAPGPLASIITPAYLLGVELGEVP
jgi:hypothetical protein